MPTASPTLDGIWLDELLYFGGSPETVHHRNLEGNRAATVHLEDGSAAVMVEGTVEWTSPDRALADQLAAASKANYGYGSPADTYMAGIWALVPASSRRGRSSPRTPRATGLL